MFCPFGLTLFGLATAWALFNYRLLDIVPEGTPLTVEAQIGIDDIADVHPGMTAEVHFASYKQRTLPLIHGQVTEISADRLTAVASAP